MQLPEKTFQIIFAAFIKPTSRNTAVELGTDHICRAVERESLLLDEFPSLLAKCFEIAFSVVKCVALFIKIRLMALQQCGLSRQLLKLIDPRSIQSTGRQGSVYLDAHIFLVSFQCVSYRPDNGICLTQFVLHGP